MSEKIDWETYYLTQCYLVAQRSIDQSTKCGAIIVSKDNRVLSQGYNGPIRNSNDAGFPTDRPRKYYYTLHAEENALLAYNGGYQDIQGSTIYVTGMPCHRCLRMIIQKGISRIVVLKGYLAKMQDDDDLYAARDMIWRYKGKLEVVELDIVDKILTMLDQTKKYIHERTNG